MRFPIKAEGRTTEGHFHGSGKHLSSPASIPKMLAQEPATTPPARGRSARSTVPSFVPMCGSDAHVFVGRVQAEHPMKTST